MGNIVTTFLFDGPVERACSLQKWCHNAEVLRKHLSFQKHVTLRTVVLTNRVQEVSNLCPRAHVRGFDPHLTAAIDRYNRGVPHVHEVTCPMTLYKLQILDEEVFQQPVIFLDADVDISLGRRMTDQMSTMNATHMSELYEAWRASPCVIQATPDHSALVNDGVMLVKPNRAMYEQSLRILNRSAWSRRHGFERNGLPQAAFPNALPLVKKAKGYWTNSWDYVCGAGGQGLFAHLSMRGSGEQFCVPQDWLIRVRHFWAGEKPWKKQPSVSCRRYFEFPVPSTSLCKTWVEQHKHHAKAACLGRDWPIL